jgi:GTPase KRas protein
MAADDADQSKVRLGIFGGGGVGKTALTLRLLRKKFVEEYIPTLADDFRHDLEVNGKKIHIEIIDTAGQDDFREMRSHFYSSVQGFLLVYSVAERGSLADVQDIYKDICTCLAKDVIPVVLVGNKADLRDEDSLTLADGQAAAKKLGGCRLLETSARTGQNVEEAFKEGVHVVQRMVFRQHQSGSGCCSVL